MHLASAFCNNSFHVILGNRKNIGRPYSTQTPIAHQNRSIFLSFLESFIKGKGLVNLLMLSGAQQCFLNNTVSLKLMIIFNRLLYIAYVTQ